jgi:hypothetical protein
MDDSIRSSRGGGAAGLRALQAGRLAFAVCLRSHIFCFHLFFVTRSVRYEEYLRRTRSNINSG